MSLQEYLEKFPELDRPCIHFIECGKKADHLIGHFGWCIGSGKLTMVTGWNEKAQLVEFDGSIGAWVNFYGLSKCDKEFVDLTDLTSRQAWKEVRNASPSNTLTYSAFKLRWEEFLQRSNEQ